MKYIKNILSVILILTFGYIFIGELVLPGNTPKNGMICRMLPGEGWEKVSDDGTREPFLVPGRTDGDITLETTLPSKLEREDNALCFRGMDIDIYIDGELREQLKTEDYRLFGDQSAEC
nr:hypothetical protein [Lachnospiraceae bacterium]